MDTYRSAARIANRAFQLLVGAEYGVRWLDNYQLKRDPSVTGGELDLARRSGTLDLYPDVEAIDPSTLPFAGFKDIRRFSTMLMEPNTFLPAVQRDFFVAGGRVVVRKFRTASEVAALPEPVVFNCTGLGARALFDDDALGPVRGQLTFLEPQPDVDYCYLTQYGDDPLYMFPRSDGIVLGGTFQHGDWSTDVDLTTQARILAEHEAIFRTSS
jgi:D-amino-acid oxidase